jgi:hypothetical protein
MFGFSQPALEPEGLETVALKALQGSVAKWQAIVNGAGHDDGPLNEPLCRAFLKDTDDCTGCPVKKRTGRDSCDGTPYEAWTVAITAEDMAKVAHVQLAFLQSLQPQRHTSVANVASTSSRQLLDL